MSQLILDNTSWKTFKDSRYNQPCWDLNSSPLGFGNEGDAERRSDISAHLPFLEFIAHQCHHITEFGSRDGFSTAALIAGCPGKVTSYDIKKTQSMYELEILQEEGRLPCKWEFKEVSSIDQSHEIEPTRLLFIDTLHCYRQLKRELDLHLKNVSKYVVFHDVVTDWEVSLDAGGEGIGRCINELLEASEWKIVYFAQFNHGLLVLERI